jgi:hypothetical protein
MPEAEEGGADVELQYMEVSEDTKDPQANCAYESKPRCINLCVFWTLMQLSMDHCAFTFRSWNETLDAWSLGTYVFTSMIGQ